MPEPQLDVVVHPQSVIHSLVEYADGSMLAQLGAPDMRTPIAYCLAWPDRMATTGARLDIGKAGPLSFEPEDTERFPALRLAREALRGGPSAPTILSAANEIAVAAFLDRRIGLLGIAETVEDVLQSMSTASLTSLDDVFAIDSAARAAATHTIAKAAKTFAASG